MQKFLFLQGPHGPFFASIGRMLQTAGADVWRVGFNAGDDAFWPDKSTYIAYTGTVQDWPAAYRGIIAAHGITDIILYGDTRPIHATAVAVAKELGLRVHVFEEGYLRPWWATYERGGSNGHSRLMDISVAQMQGALARRDNEVTEAPAHWGDMREHVFYGALYHWFLTVGSRSYPNFQRHRELTPLQEAYFYTRRMLSAPFIAIERQLKTRKIKDGGFPYHLVLMQLEHDSSFQMHSPFRKMEEFLDVVLAGFAQGAPRHHQIVFKAHPLEMGRRPYAAMLKVMAEKYQLVGRIHYVSGGKLSGLLDHAKTAVTVNSTAGQQALWRGLPLKLFGTAIYDKPGLVSQQDIVEFFRAPQRPDSRSYRDYRAFLLETSQVPGGFYSRRARHQLMRRVVDQVLADNDPYDAVLSSDDPTGLRVVK
ncbi:capsular polysaccharide export protein KpsS [Ketogulonicigenium robustum]|uniref:Capsular polysaccharide export protein KpsS n=1 Tax=Ketogulonicigenium robustum TaxID=92947 RepID=A0A1W6P0G6_9RHOB|nr:capsular biosynthesis protein [Ketogulonicigenium robustum]ARO14820.1 capsular polysaccharide export protein KpsS [Ketogulonicigenium robustum]